MSGSRGLPTRSRNRGTFAEAARAAGVKRIVYLGGFGADESALSHHLRSRHEVGDVLRPSGVEIIEFRAAIIIGSGSISFEMMRYLTERLPVMIAPRWVTTRSQPIAIRDVLRYLVGALDLPDGDSHIYEIGGADVVTYREMMLRYATCAISSADRHRAVLYAAPFLVLGSPRDPDFRAARAATDFGPAQRSHRPRYRCGARFPEIRADRLRYRGRTCVRSLPYHRPRDNVVRCLRRSQAAGQL